MTTTGHPGSRTRIMPVVVVIVVVRAAERTPPRGGDASKYDGKRPGEARRRRPAPFAAGSTGGTSSTIFTSLVQLRDHSGTRDGLNSGSLRDSVQLRADGTGRARRDGGGGPIVVPRRAVFCRVTAHKASVLIAPRLSRVNRGRSSRHPWTSYFRARGTLRTTGNSKGDRPGHAGVVSPSGVEACQVDDANRQKTR